MKENDEPRDAEDVCVIGQELKILDVKYSLNQLLTALRLKCEGLPKLPNSSYLEMKPITSDNRPVEGFENLDSLPTGIEPYSEESSSLSTPSTSTSTSNSGRPYEVLSMSIWGQNEINQSDDNKVRPFIQTTIKSEVMNDIRTEVKTEPPVQNEIKEEPL